eukprot:1480019-Rhodomonas_salina.1
MGGSTAFWRRTQSPRVASWNAAKPRDGFYMKSLALVRGALTNTNSGTCSVWRGCAMRGGGRSVLQRAMHGGGRIRGRFC